MVPCSFSFTTAAVYDPAANAWLQIASMSNARMGPGSAVANFQGQPRFYVIGGLDIVDITVGDVFHKPNLEEYDPVMNSWRVVGTHAAQKIDLTLNSADPTPLLTLA